MTLPQQIEEFRDAIRNEIAYIREHKPTPEEIQTRIQKLITVNGPLFDLQAAMIKGVPPALADRAFLVGRNMLRWSSIGLGFILKKRGHNSPISSDEIAKQLPTKRAVDMWWKAGDRHILNTSLLGLLMDRSK